jgi:hypothetical protein
VVARGAVLDGPPGQHGRTVTLDVDMPKARIEDVMYMVVKAAKPPMKGALKLTTKLVIPPGTSDVIRRLQLNGHFDIHHATFTNYDVQGRIVELSRRGRGNPADQARPQVASDFNGRFIQRNGVLTLEELRFDVPGARVTLNGRYGLEAETIDFKGNLLLDAKVSQTVTGFKSLLLRLADPLFSRPGGGSSIPIKIEGTRTNPKFGLDMSRVFKRGDGF